MRRRKPNPGARFVVFLILATVPLFLAGWLLRDLIAEHTRGSLVVVAWANLVFAVLLLLADRFSLRVRRAEHLTVVDALVVGVFQALALVPGTSRAGAVITAARLLSCERREAARISLLLSIPAILGAGGAAFLEGPRLAAAPQMALLAALCFAAALPAIAFLMRWVARSGYGLFVAYRLLLAAVLFLWLYGPLALWVA